MEAIWTNVTDTVMQPIKAFQRLRERPQVLAACVLFIAGQLAFGAAGAGMTTGIDWGPAGTVILAIVTGIPLLLLSALFTQLSARALRARGPYWALVSAFGFTSIPLILQAPVALLAAAAGVVWLATVGQVGLGIWSLVLDVLAIRETYSVSTGRAIGILALTFLFFALIGALIGVVLGLIGAIFLGGIMP